MQTSVTFVLNSVVFKNNPFFMRVALINTEAPKWHAAAH